MRLDDLNVSVGRLETLLEVFAGAEASNQENSLNWPVSFIPFAMLGVVGL